MGSVAKGTSLLTVAALLLGCSTLLSTSKESLSARRSADRIVPEHIILIALDGVRREDVFNGADARLTTELRSAQEIVPNLSNLARRGVALGVPGTEISLRASGPNYVSLPGYLEILTGQSAECQENNCEKLPPHGLIDAIAATTSEPRGELAIISSWERIEHTVAKADLGTFVSTGRSGGNAAAKSLGPRTRALLDKARDVRPAPGHGDYRPDPQTIEIALAYLEEERPRFAFVSLGDTDEFAHHDDYDAYLRALTRADAFVGQVVDLADAWRAKGERTAIFVTTDHGRAKNFRDHGREHPESADVWLIAGGDGIAPIQGSPPNSERRLRDVAHTIAVLADVPFPNEGESGSCISEMLAFSPAF